MLEVAAIAKDQGKTESRKAKLEKRAQALQSSRQAILKQEVADRTRETRTIVGRMAKAIAVP